MSFKSLTISKKTEQSKEWIENPDYQELTNSVIRSRIIPRTEVVLLDESVDGESRRVVAKLTDNGSLMISGQDIGPSVEGIFGFVEYEYSHTIPAAYIAAFFEILGAKQVTDILGAIDHFGRLRYPEIIDALEKAKETVPVQFWSYL